MQRAIRPRTPARGMYLISCPPYDQWREMRHRSLSSNYVLFLYLFQTNGHGHLCDLPHRPCRTSIYIAPSSGYIAQGAPHPPPPSTHARLVTLGSCGLSSTLAILSADDTEAGNDAVDVASWHTARLQRALRVLCALWRIVISPGWTHAVRCDLAPSCPPGR